MGIAPGVLLIAGPGSAGKTTLGRSLARRFGLRHVELDQVLHDAPALPVEARWFEETSQFWREPIDGLLDRLVAVIEAMTPTVNVLVSEHIAARDPVVIEGRQLDPSVIPR